MVPIIMVQWKTNLNERKLILKIHPFSTERWLWEEGEAPFISRGVRPFGRGPTTRSLGVLLTMDINHLQVLGWSSKWQKVEHSELMICRFCSAWFQCFLSGDPWSGMRRIDLEVMFFVRVSPKTFERWQWFFAVFFVGGGRKSYHYFMSF